MEEVNADLSLIYQTEKDFLKELARVSKYIEKIKKYKKKIFINDKNLYEVLFLDEKISKELETLYIYSHFLSDLDLKNSKASNNFNKVRGLYIKYAALASFIIPELLEKDFKYIKELVNKDERLKLYEKNLSDIYKSKKHKLSEVEEKLLNESSSLNNSLNDGLIKLLNVDTKFEQINNLDVNFNNYEKLICNNDANFRKKVYESIVKKLENIKYTSASLLNGIITYNNFVSKTKKYSSALDMFLSKNNIETIVYDSLIKYVGLNIKTFDSYWGLKRKKLKSGNINIYDVSVPLINEYDLCYSINDARNLILGSLLVLGKDYCDIVNNLFIDQKLDLSKSKNKKEIAYSTSSYNHGSFIFMKYDNSFKSLTTLSHEIGHAAHFEISRRKNNFNNYEPSIFTAEIASQVNEILLNKYMFKMAKTKQEKMFILGDHLQDFEYVMRKATMTAHFEKNIHEYNAKGNTLNVDYLDSEYKKLLNKYYNGNIKLNNESENFWIIYSQMFGKYYLYQYTTGYIAALLIAEEIYKGNKDASVNYLKMLESGKKLDPIKLLKIVDIDITNSKTYKKVFKIFEENIKLYENINNSKEEKINE